MSLGPRQLQSTTLPPQPPGLNPRSYPTSFGISWFLQTYHHPLVKVRGEGKSRDRKREYGERVVENGGVPGDERKRGDCRRGAAVTRESHGKVLRGFMRRAAAPGGPCPDCHGGRDDARLSLWSYRDGLTYHKRRGPRRRRPRGPGWSPRVPVSVGSRGWWFESSPWEASRSSGAPRSRARGRAPSVGLLRFSVGAPAGSIPSVGTEVSGVGAV